MTTTSTPQPPQPRLQPVRAVVLRADPRRHPGLLGDVVVIAGFVVLAFLLYRFLWLDLEQAYLVDSNQDQNMWEWFFAVTARSVVELKNPFVTDRQNYPLGVNLMANTAMLGIGIPLAPITLAFGPTVTWALALTGGLAGTATAWYWVFSRHLVRTRSAAVIGATVCGFAPPIISHAKAHPNFVALFVIPFIVLRLVLLTRGERVLRHGVILGLLLAYQVFLGEEVLLIAAVTLVIFAVTYAVMRPEHAVAVARPVAGGVGVAAGVALIVVALPLWWQFFGPQSYTHIEHGLAGNDASTFTAFPSASLAGDAEVASEFSMNPAEENAFFGWPLVVLMVGVTIALWRVVVARALAVTMFVIAWVSMGMLVVIDGNVTSIPGPWMLLFDLPLFETMLESRIALGCVPLAGMLLAMATDRVIRLEAPRDWRYAALLGWLGVVVCVAIPIVPTAFAVEKRSETPTFFADDHWRRYVETGSVAVVPLPEGNDADALHWQIDAGLDFPIPDGYFVGPDSDGSGIYGPVQRPTSVLLRDVAEDGETPRVTEQDRLAMVEDLNFWETDVVVLPRDTEHQRELRATVGQLLNNPGDEVADAWVWDVRALRTDA